MAVVSANKNLDGRAVVEVELRLPNNQFVPFNAINVAHVSSTITESIKGISTHELIVRAPTTDYLDTVIRFAQSTGTPRIRYRLGFGRPGTSVFLPWQDHIITSISGAIEGVGNTAGHFLRLSTKDILFTIERSTRVAARRGKISDIVQSIANVNGITSTVIEPTVGEGLWIQSYVDDHDFVRNRLVPRAINDKGRGCYSFYVQDNVLHFHSPDYQASLKDVTYYGPNNFGLTQLDESQTMLERGASSVRVVAYDPYSATMGEIACDPEKTLRLGNVMPPLISIPGADLNIPFHISTNTVLEAAGLAQSIYENARAQTLGLKLDVTRSLLLRVGDLVRVGISPEPGKSSVWSGVYQVAQSGYMVQGGTLVSTIVLKRGEFQTSNLAPTQSLLLGNTLVVSNTAAPGQPLNLKALESSTLTHGAGEAGFISTFVSTEDPNSAPNPTPVY